MLHLKQEAYTPVPSGPKRKEEDLLVYLWRLYGKREQSSPERRKETEALQLGIEKSMMSEVNLLRPVE